MHHAYPFCDGIQWVFNIRLNAINVNFAFLAVFHAKKDLHQSRLAGAVFTYQRVDLVGSDAEGNILIRHETIGVYFGYSFYF